MDPLSFYLYRALGALALGPAVAWPVVTGRFGSRWGDRLGYTLQGGGNPLWLHGASVGESGGNLSILASLRELGYQGPALLSAATPGGLDFLESSLAKAGTDKPGGQPSPKNRTYPGLYSPTQLAAAPLDFLGAPGRFLDRVAPRALLVLETEIWPELFYQCSLRSIPVLLLSARISQRSLERFGRAKSFMRQAMAIPSLVATISQADQSRLAELGVEPEKSVVIGSPKFDSLIGQARATLASLPQKTQSELSGRDHWDSQATSLASAISLMAAPASGPNPLILAGSTHPGEEELIMEAVMALPAPGASLAIAPRHLVRIPEVSRLVESFTLKPSPYSETGTLRPGPGSVTIVDTMGNLSGLYRECDLAIVGGSFFNGDGHNPLEPAAFGKPIVFGQSMSSFKGPAEKLESIGAATVAPRAFLATAIASLLASPEKASRAGLAGLWLLSRQRPVAPILAQGILEFLSEPAPQGSQKAMAYLRSQALVQGGPGLYP